MDKLCGKIFSCITYSGVVRAARDGVNVSTPSIEVSNVSKRYGKRTVIQDVSFTVNPGEVYALVGPNGAGKTTIIRLVTGLAFPSSGSVKLMDLSLQENPKVRSRLGAVVEAPAAFYPYLTGYGNLKLHARLAGGVEDVRIDEVLSMMELSDARDRKVGVYSLGMRQRLGVAAALLNKPDILILDEPASGMDPLSLHLVHSVLQRAAQNGTAVLLTTHHLDEVVAYCSRVAIMEEGRFIDEVNLLDRRERYRVRVSDIMAAKALLEAQPYVKHVVARSEDLIAILAKPEDLGRLTRDLLSNRIELFELTKDIFNLREYYREQLNKPGAVREPA